MHGLVLLASCRRTHAKARGAAGKKTANVIKQGKLYTISMHSGAGNLRLNEPSAKRVKPKQLLFDYNHFSNARNNVQFARASDTRARQQLPLPFHCVSIVEKFTTRAICDALPSPSQGFLLRRWRKSSRSSSSA